MGAAEGHLPPNMYVKKITPVDLWEKKGKSTKKISEDLRVLDPKNPPVTRQKGQSDCQKREKVDSKNTEGRLAPSHTNERGEYYQKKKKKGVN